MVCLAGRPGEQSRGKADGLPTTRCVIVYGRGKRQKPKRRSKQSEDGGSDASHGGEWARDASSSYTSQWPRQTLAGPRGGGGPRGRPRCHREGQGRGDPPPTTRAGASGSGRSGGAPPPRRPHRGWTSVRWSTRRNPQGKRLAVAVYDHARHRSAGAIDGKAGRKGGGEEGGEVSPLPAPPMSAPRAEQVPTAPPSHLAPLTSQHPRRGVHTPLPTPPPPPSPPPPPPPSPPPSPLRCRGTWRYTRQRRGGGRQKKNAKKKKEKWKREAAAARQQRRP